jgi:hypothetical protein
MVGILRILLICCLLSATAAAQQPDNRRFRVEGLVVESATGQPLPQVKVEILYYVGRETVFTGVDGTFSFNGIPVGEAHITVAKTGYLVPGKTLVETLGGLLSNRIEVGPDTGKVVLKLERGGAIISGRVTGKDGQPLPGATIHALGRTIINGWRTLMPGKVSVTDKDGNFIGTLPPGRYYLSVSTDVLRSDKVLGAQTPAPSETYPALVYYPGVADLAAAKPLDVAAGQRIEVQFALSMVPAYTVAGNVMAPSEWYRCPWIFDSLELHQLSFNGDVATLCDEESGAFRFSPLPAGTYILRLLSPSMETFTQKITVTNNVTDLKFYPNSFPDIEVVVRTEFSKTPATPVCTREQQRIRVQSCLGIWLHLIALDDGPAGLNAGQESLLKSVAPGKYRVQTGLTYSAYVHGAYVQSMRSGSLDLFHEVLTVPEQGTVVPIEIVLRDDSAKLKVTVSAKMPAQEAHIVAFRDGTLLPVFWAPSGHPGKEISLPPLAPGTYRLFAFDYLDGLEYKNLEALAKYASKATTVTLSANENLSLTVNLIHNER